MSKTNLMAKKSSTFSLIEKSLMKNQQKTAKIRKILRNNDFVFSCNLKRKNNSLDIKHFY